MSEASTPSKSKSLRAEEPTWFWKLDFGLLKEAAAIRARDPKDFRGAVLTYFGFGGRDDGPVIERMRADPEGRRVLDNRTPLPPGILTPEAFADFPTDSLGYQYFRHCRDNDLDPQFIAEESEKVAREFPATDEHRFTYNRYRDSHDFWHVLTGYGTDMAGEAGVIAWTYAQTRNRGYLLIFLLNAMMCTRRGRPDVFKTCWQGYRQGRRDRFMLAIDWNAHMHRPLKTVREELGGSAAAPYAAFHMPDAPGAPDLPNAADAKRSSSN
ncbi:MAG: Coq4 family protein [Myxococcota bacterium]